MQIDHLWSRTDALFRREISDDVADIWLSQLTAAALTDDVLFLTGSERVRSWVDLRYGRVLTRCVARAAGADLRIALVAPDEVPLPGSPSSDSDSRDWHSSPLNPRYNFENFVIGDSNHIAHAAALSVAEQPAHAFNPLFVYGAPGVGKTHLLHSIGNFLASRARDVNVRYLTAENFAAIFRSVLRNNTIQDFKEDLRRTDVLLIDDVQFLQNKAKTEEEFFHTFNHLHESGRQLVISCDRTPRKLELLADRLRERFESGLVVEIEQPDAALRRAVLRKRVRSERIPLDDDRALERIAERAPANIRSLEGALIRVTAFASMRGQTVTPELVDQLLDALHPGGWSTRVDRPATTVPVDDIQRMVAEHFELSLDELLGPDRSRRVTGPRQIAMFLACELSGESLPVIAAAFHRDHSTVVHARDKVRAARRNDPAAADAVDRLKSVIHERDRVVDDQS